MLCRVQYSLTFVALSVTVTVTRVAHCYLARRSKRSVSMNELAKGTFVNKTVAYGSRVVLLAERGRAVYSRDWPVLFGGRS